MKKNEKQLDQWESNRLTIIDPHKVRLSQKGDTVMVFLNHKTVMMFSKKFLEAVLTRSYQKKGA